MIQVLNKERATMILFEKAVKHDETFHGIVALACRHSLSYRTNNPAFEKSLEHGWHLPCPKCRGAA